MIGLVITSESLIMINTSSSPSLQTITLGMIYIIIPITYLSILIPPTCMLLNQKTLSLMVNLIVSRIQSWPMMHLTKRMCPIFQLPSRWTSLIPLVLKKISCWGKFVPQIQKLLPTNPSSKISKLSLLGPIPRCLDLTWPLLNITLIHGRIPFLFEKRKDRYTLTRHPKSKMKSINWKRWASFIPLRTLDGSLT